MFQVQFNYEVTGNDGFSGTDSFAHPSFEAASGDLQDMIAVWYGDKVYAIDPDTGAQYRMTSCPKLVRM